MKNFTMYNISLVRCSAQATATEGKVPVYVEAFLALAQIVLSYTLSEETGIFPPPFSVIRFVP